MFTRSIRLFGRFIFLPLYIVLLHYALNICVWRFPELHSVSFCLFNCEKYTVTFVRVFPDDMFFGFVFCRYQYLPRHDRASVRRFGDLPNIFSNVLWYCRVRSPSRTVYYACLPVFNVLETCCNQTSFGE